MASAELLLHPVRLRIVQAFLGERALTTTDLRTELTDVPTATLYRQVGALVDGGVLEVVDERKVRGAVERTYRLRAANATIGAEEAAAMSVDEHRQAFMTFVAGLLADYDRYLAGDVDLGRDLVGYRQNALWLSDDELRDFIADLRDVVLARAGLGPSPQRQRRLFTTVLMPSGPVASSPVGRATGPDDAS